ncbi:MAG: hypothetical protein FWC54_02840 [Actinomycetia bacterium]|nr:hypothetical protein [Actinomycetes bacterium]
MWKNLFSLSWWRSTINGLSMAEISHRWAQVVTVFHNPRSNPVMFLMIMAVIVVLILILVLTVAMIVSAVTSRQERYALVDDKGKKAAALSDESVKAQAVRKYRSSWKRYSTALFIVGGAFVLLLCVGVSTSTSAYCKACHGNDKKVAVMQSGVHKDQSCVKCHEGGATFARYTVNSVQRVGHLVTGFTSGQPTGYSTAPAGACLNCHDKRITGDTVATNLGNNTISMSHKEPLAASMQCSRCHNMTTAKSPIASSGTMNTCLICHNGSDASDKCVICHLNTPSKTIVSSGASPANADRLINTDPRAQCYTCHAADAATCDGCHGMRIPHPGDFENTHPRAVARSGLAACFRCHNNANTTGGAQSCSQCHGQDPGTGKWDFQ